MQGAGQNNMQIRAREINQSLTSCFVPHVSPSFSVSFLFFFWVVYGGLELILLHPNLKCWDCTCVPLWQVYVVLETKLEPWASYVLSKHCTNRTTSLNRSLP